MTSESKQYKTLTITVGIESPIYQIDFTRLGFNKCSNVLCPKFNRQS